MSKCLNGPPIRAVFDWSAGLKCSSPWPKAEHISLTRWGRSIGIGRFVHQKAVLLHFFVERGAIDVEHPRGLLAVPVEGLERLDDGAFFGLLDCFLERPDAQRQVRPGG